MASQTPGVQSRFGCAASKATNSSRSFVVSQRRVQASLRARRHDAPRGADWSRTTPELARELLEGIGGCATADQVLPWLVAELKDRRM